MFRTLRSRLVISHILPLVLIIPLMFVALVYLLESRFLFPKLTEDLLGNARLITQFTRTEFQSDGQNLDIRFTLVRMQLNPAIRLVYTDPDGIIRYSNDPDYQRFLGDRLAIPSLAQAKAGEEVVLSDYSFLLPGSKYNIQVLIPIPGVDKPVAGILWLTYYEASITKLFRQMRNLSILAMLGSLVIGAFLGSVLALNISNPVRKATHAIQHLTRGESSEALEEQGPEEMRDLIRAVNVLVSRLHELEAARRQLLANLVHELGRPLGALRSAIQALAKGAGEDHQLLGELTAGMDEETARLQNLLNELAHLHDQVLGSLELLRQETYLSEWLPRMLLPWGEAAGEKRLHWEVDIPTNLPPVQVDRGRLSQVIGNLVSNAVKYTPTGGSVSVSVGRQDGDLWISVKDNGPGISKDEREKIFDPFYRGDQGRRIKQGMGLGLSIARDLTDAHEGHIELESASGFGSTFTVWLPLNN